MRTRFIEEVFFPAVEKESNGRLKIEAHWGGKLSTSYDALRTVAAGSRADMAVVVPEYSPEQLPLHQIFKSFPVGPSGENQAGFFRRVYDQIPAFSQETERAGIVNLLCSTGYPSAFFSARPLDSLENIRGVRRVSGTRTFWQTPEPFPLRCRGARGFPTPCGPARSTV